MSSVDKVSQKKKRFLRWKAGRLKHLKKIEELAMNVSYYYEVST